MHRFLKPEQIIVIIVSNTLHDRGQRNSIIVSHINLNNLWLQGKILLIKHVVFFPCMNTAKARMRHLINFMVKKTSNF